MSIFLYRKHFWRNKPKLNNEGEGTFYCRMYLFNRKRKGGKLMMKKQKGLVPIYRKEKDYSIFYDRENDTYYRYQQQESYTILIMFLFSIALLGLVTLTNEVFIYYRFAGIAYHLMYITVTLLTLLLSYYTAQIIHHKFYKQSPQEIFLDPYHLKKYAEQGLKQMKIMIGIGYPIFPCFLHSSISISPFRITGACWFRKCGII